MEHLVLSCEYEVVEEDVFVCHVPCGSKTIDTVDDGSSNESNNSSRDCTIYVEKVVRIEDCDNGAVEEVMIPAIQAIVALHFHTSYRTFLCQFNLHFMLGDTPVYGKNMQFGHAHPAACILNIHSQSPTKRWELQVTWLCDYNRSLSPGSQVLTDVDEVWQVVIPHWGTHTPVALSWDYNLWDWCTPGLAPRHTPPSNQWIPFLVIHLRGVPNPVFYHLHWDEVFRAPLGSLFHHAGPVNCSSLLYTLQLAMQNPHTESV